jgi:hypothetical protein
MRKLYGPALVALLLACGTPTEEQDPVGTASTELKRSAQIEAFSVEARTTTQAVKVKPRSICPGEFAVLTTKVSNNRTVDVFVFITVTTATGDIVIEPFFVVPPGKKEITTSFLASPGILPGTYYVTTRIQDASGAVLDASSAVSLVVEPTC